MSSLNPISDSDSDYDYDSDDISESSTVLHEHESFETLKPRVLQLCQTLMPQVFNGEISIEKMAGGGYNRIIGISSLNRTTSTSSHYVLRIPRFFDEADIDRDLALLQWLGHRSDVLVPKVIASDITSNNVLQSPYMVQERAPGSDLLAARPTLTHENMCRIAHDLGTFFAALHSIQSSSAGYPVLSPSEGALMIRPFQDTDESAASRYENGPPRQTTLEMVLSFLRYKKIEFEADGPDSAMEVAWCDLFSSIASEMNTLGVLREDHNCLCHQDLYPRNILVNPSSGQFKIITAVLDWDSAVFAPLFMSCKPPRWLWAWSGDEDDEDEQLPNDEPATPAMAEIKRVFEDTAGPIYHQFAYGAQYRLARRFIRQMLRGLTGDEDVRAAELLKDEWAQMKTELANGDMMEM